MECIRKIITSIDDASLSTTIDNKIVKISPLEFVFAYSSISQNDFKTSAYRKPLIDLFQSLESAFPGSAFIAAKFLINDIDRNSMGSLDIQKMCSNEIFDAIESLMSAEEGSVVKEIIKVGGLFRSSKFNSLRCGDNYVIKSLTKESVSLNIAKDFQSLGANKFDDAIIITSDSVFEKMSEIDNIVRWAQGLDKTLVLVARGFLPEVTSTLFYNFLNKKLSVIPCTIEYSDDDPFNLDDTAKICGTQMVVGPVSVYDDDSLSKISGELIEVNISNSQLRVVPKESCFDIENLDFDTMNKERKDRLGKGSIKVSLPENATLLQKSRIRKGIQLYRSCAREDVCKINKTNYPISVRSLGRILSSVDYFLKETRRTKFCIKVQDEMAV